MANPVYSQTPGMLNAAAGVAQNDARAAAEQLLHRGLDYYDREDFEAALDCYQQAVYVDPQFAMGYNNLGMVLIDLDRCAEAIPALNQAIRLDPQNAEAYNNLGFALRREKREIEAASAYNAFLLIDPEVEEGPRIRAWIEKVRQASGLSEIPMFAIDPVPEAETTREASLEKAELDPPLPAPAAQPPSPKIAKLPTWKATMEAPPAAGWKPDYLQANEAPAAEKKFPEEPNAAEPKENFKAPPQTQAPSTATASMDPADQIERIEQGMDAFADGDLDRAMKLFQSVLQEEPQNVEAQTGIGKVLVRMERYEEGIASLQVASELAPHDPAPYYVLGYALRQLDRNEAAADAYDRFLKILPYALDAAKMREWIDHIRGEEPSDESGIPREDATLSMVTLQDTAATDLKYKEALEAFQEGDIEKAQRKCLKNLHENPGHYLSRLLLGRIYLREKQFNEAIEQLEGCLTTKPDYPDALYFLGQAYEKTGNTEKAKAAFQHCLDAAPQGPRAEQVRDLLSKFSEKTLIVEIKQVQCELCLRQFNEKDVRRFEGKLTCNKCLELIGGVEEDTPSSSSAVMPMTGIARALPRKKGKMGFVAASVLLLGAGVAVAWFYTPLPELIGKNERSGARMRPAQLIEEPVETETERKQPEHAFDWNLVKLSGVPQKRILPWAEWSFQPQLIGLQDAPPNLQLKYNMKKHPPGMELDPATGKLSWYPQTDRFVDLLKGIGLEVVVTVTGTIFEDQSERVVFERTLPFVLSHQFGFIEGDRTSLDLSLHDRVEMVAADLNGDRRDDLALAAGHYAKGALKLFFQKPGQPLPVPLIYEVDGQIGALQALDLNADGKEDLLVASRYSGKVLAYVQDRKNQLVPEGELSLNAPVMALRAHPMNDGTIELLTLLGRERALAVSQYRSGKFGEATRIQLNAHTGEGSILPWRHTAEITQYLLLLPLAHEALWSIDKRDGRWSVPQPVPSTPQWIQSAVVVRQGEQRALALLHKLGRASSLSLLQWVDSQWQIRPQEKFVFTDEALALQAEDWNADGRDDLVVVNRHGIELFFQTAQGFVPGPVYRNLGELTGKTILADLNGDGQKDILAIGSDFKARLLLSRIVEASLQIAEDIPVLDWPLREEIAAVRLEKRIEHADRGFSVGLPAGFTAMLNDPRGFDLLAGGDAELTRRGQLSIEVKTGAPKPLDEEHLVLLSKPYKTLEWDGSPAPGALGGMKTIRLAGHYLDRALKRQNVVIYLVDLNERHIVMRLEAPEERWDSLQLPLEAIARSFALFERHASGDEKTSNERR